MNDYLLQILGIVSTILSLIIVFFASKQNTLKWPLSILSNCLAIYIYLQKLLYIKFTITILLIINSFYGWIKWMNKENIFIPKGTSSKESKEKLKVTKTKFSILMLQIGIFFVFGVIVAIIEYYATNKYISFAESFSIFALLGHWMMARKKIETWVIWICLDSIFIIICFKKSLYPFVFKYTIYVILAIYGYFNWKKYLKSHDNDHK